MYDIQQEDKEETLFLSSNGGVLCSNQWHVAVSIKPLPASVQK